MSGSDGSPYKTSAARRAQCRVNQHRYRANTNALIERLENQVEELTLETARLQGCLDYHRRRQVWQIPRPFDRLAGVRIVYDYFGCFRYGFHCQDPIHADRLLTHDMTYLNNLSLFEFKEQWYRYESYFGGFDMQCDQASSIVDENINVVACRGRVRLWITQITLQKVFPSLISNYENIQPLLGQVLELSFDARFELDPDQHRIRAIDADASFTLCLAKILGDMEIAAETMQNALVNGVLLLGGSLLQENQLNL